MHAPSRLLPSAREYGIMHRKATIANQWPGLKKKGLV